MSATNGRGKSKPSRPRNKYTSNSSTNIGKNQSLHGNEGEFYMLDNSVVNGLIEAVSPSGDFGLLYARTMDKTSKKTSVESSPKVIKLLQLKKVVIRNINPNQCLEERFLDSEIAKVNSVAPRPERELEPYFECAPEDETDILESGARFPPAQMFNINAKAYNVKSSYNPELDGYTIPLDKSAPDFKEKEKRCAKLAQEMEQDKSSKNDDYDENCDEETLFSAVSRTDKPKLHPRTSVPFKRSGHVGATISKQVSSTNGDYNAAAVPIDSTTNSQTVDIDDANNKSGNTRPNHINKGKVQALSECNSGDKAATPLNCSPLEEVSSSTVDSPKKEKTLDYDLDAPPFVPEKINESYQDSSQISGSVIPPQNAHQPAFIPQSMTNLPNMPIPNTQQFQGPQIQKFINAYDPSKLGMIHSHPNNQVRSGSQPVQQPNTIVPAMPMNAAKNILSATSSVQKPTPQPGQVRQQRSAEQPTAQLVNQYPHFQSSYPMCNISQPMMPNGSHGYNMLSMTDPSQCSVMQFPLAYSSKVCVDSPNPQLSSVMISTGSGHPASVSVAGSAVGLQYMPHMSGNVLTTSHLTGQQLPPAQLPNHGPQFPAQTAYSLVASGQTSSSQPGNYSMTNSPQQAQNIVAQQAANGNQNMAAVQQQQNPQQPQQQPQTALINQQLLQQQALGQVQQNTLPLHYVQAMGHPPHVNFFPHSMNIPAHQPGPYGIYQHGQNPKSGCSYALSMASNAMTQNLLSSHTVSSQQHIHSQSQQQSQTLPGVSVTSSISNTMPQPTQSLSNQPSQTMTMS